MEDGIQGVVPIVVAARIGLPMPMTTTVMDPAAADRGCNRLDWNLARAVVEVLANDTSIRGGGGGRCCCSASARSVSSALDPSIYRHDPRKGRQRIVPKSCGPSNPRPLASRPIPGIGLGRVGEMCRVLGDLRPCRRWQWR